MKATLFKEVGYSLNKLIEDIDRGEIALPDIQRPFVWTATKVRDLFDSMYMGFPVGYLLFWANGASPGARQIGTGQRQAAARLLIVDGQQRLTSLYAVMKGLPVVAEDYAEHVIRIAFRPRDNTFSVADAAIEDVPFAVELRGGGPGVDGEAGMRIAASSIGGGTVVRARSRSIATARVARSR